jgi:hypothetical protein
LIPLRIVGPLDGRLVRLLSRWRVASAGGSDVRGISRSGIPSDFFFQSEELGSLTPAFRHMSATGIYCGKALILNGPVSGRR